jgi:hypothetical protein
MIRVQELASLIDDALNAELNRDEGNGEYKKYPNLNSKWGRYRFNVVADTADYKRPEREGNTVTYFIQGNLLLVGNNVESTQSGRINASLQTTLELLVPIIDAEDEDGNKELVSSVRSLLDSVLTTNGSGGKDKTIQYGYQYNIAVSGARATVPMIGDSFIFSIEIEWYFIEGGINSRDIVLKYEASSIIDYTAFGIRRATTQESDVPSDSQNGSAKNVDLASVFTLNIAMPLLDTTFCRICAEYALGNREIGKNMRISVSFPFPDKITVSQTMTLSISEASINVEGVMNASLSVTLTEAMDE